MNTIPLSLYIDIEKGKVADLEVVARTALAWDALTKEIFYIADPALDVRVEIVNGTKGSVSLNTIIKAISKVAEKNPKRAGVIIGLLAIFASSPAEHFSDHFWTEVYELLGHKDEPAEQPSAAEKLQIVLDARHMAYGIW